MKKYHKENKRIEKAPDDKITDIHYDFMERIYESRSILLTNESSLYDFSSLTEKKTNAEWCAYWILQIEKNYKINLEDVVKENSDLNIVKIVDELEKRLFLVEKKKLKL